MTVEAAIAVTTMYDTIGRDAGNIPAAAAKAAGYVTGTLDIVWSDSAWGRLTVAGKVKVDQSELGNVYAAGLANVYDVEKYAGTPGRFAQAAAERHNRGELNCVYGSRTTLEQIVPALKAVPGMDAGWWGGTCCWLADWSLSLAEASRLVGTSMFGGLHVVAVQWATPTSNPDVAVGGGTLKSLNLDLSVARSDWFPAKATPAPWQTQALNLAKSVQADGAQLVKLIEAHT